MNFDSRFGAAVLEPIADVDFAAHAIPEPPLRAAVGRLPVATGFSLRCVAPRGNVNHNAVCRLTQAKACSYQIITSEQPHGAGEEEDLHPDELQREAERLVHLDADRLPVVAG